MRKVAFLFASHMAFRSLAATCVIIGCAVLAGAPAARGEDTWRHVYELPLEAQTNARTSFATVRRDTLIRGIGAMARVDADTSRVIVIRPAGSGKVTDVHVTPGARVRKGQSLVSYTDHSLHELHLQYAQMQAALDSARAGALEAEQLYKRGLALAGSAVSTGELQKRRMILEQQRGLVAARKADLETLEHRRTEEFTSVTERIVEDEASDLVSPVDGVVQSVNSAVASDITAGDKVVTIVDLSRLWLVADLSPDDASRIDPGDRAVFRPSGQGGGSGGESESGPRDAGKNAGNNAGRDTGDDPAMDNTAIVARVDTIEGLADPATGLVRVVCVLDHPPPRLRPGMMLDARFETGSGARGLIVPQAALQEIDGQTVVFLRRSPTRFVPVVVQELAGNDEEAAVSGALQAGDVVMAQGSFVLKSMALLGSLASD